MNEQNLKVLLVENDLGDSFFWEGILSKIPGPNIEFTHIKQFSEVDKHLMGNSPDVILLDLTPNEGEGLEIFLEIYNMVPNVPIIVITGREDKNLADKTMQEGAQDCLVKNEIDDYLLGRSIRYAIERQKHLKNLRSFLIIDELTGLYNRRGFLTLAEQQLKIANRTGQSLLMIFADLDDLKSINDSLGHLRGDLALMETAHVLREAFRETDILARLGGDEFVALLADGKEIDEGIHVKRFKKALHEHNSYRERNFRLSVSMGTARYDPSLPCSVAQLLEQADRLMYVRKKFIKNQVRVQPLTVDVKN